MLFAAHRLPRVMHLQRARFANQGRMEFGPRALGAPSILVDARSPTMQKMLNLK
jgi:predicted NodU family carbamoyl transferase